jgi:hypothetical protein
MTPINFSLPGFFKKTGAGVAEFNEDAPPITDDLLVFFDPDYGVFSDDGHTLAVDGDNIRQMWDRSATGNTLTQNQANAQPIYNTTQFGNGNAAISAVNDWFYFTDDLDLDNTTSWTWYFVYEKTNTTAIMYSYFLGASGGYPRSEFRSNLIQIRGTTGSGRNVAYNDDGALKVIAVTVDRSANEFKLYANGSYIGTSVSQVSNWPVDIGRIFGSSNFVTYFGNSMFYTDAHDATQISQVSGWLNEKYDIYDPYAPPITDGLELYMNPDLETYSDLGVTLATDGDNIRQINDRSGNDNTLTQTSASFQPLYDTSEFGNGNASLFTGSYDSLDFESSIVIPDASSWTFYTVYKKDVLGDYSAAIGNRGGEDSSHINFRSGYVRASDDSNQYNWNAHTDDTTLKVMAVVVDSTANTISVYKNGSLVVSNSLTYSDTFTFRTLFAHSGIPGTNTYWGNALLFSEKHDSTEVGTMSDWLNDKYDIY